jgi:Trk K+ transport system NAD-binding subunit
MKIIILGAGEVGGNLAQNLTKEASDITVVDSDSDRLRELQDRIDIRTVRGMGSHPDVLRQAGAEDADMLIAVTNSVKWPTPCFIRQQKSPAFALPLILTMAYFETKPRL